MGPQWCGRAAQIHSALSVPPLASTPPHPPPVMVDEATGSIKVIDLGELYSTEKGCGGGGRGGAELGESWLGLGTSMNEDHDTNEERIEDESGGGSVRRAWEAQPRRRAGGSARRVQEAVGEAWPQESWPGARARRRRKRRRGRIRRRQTGVGHDRHEPWWRGHHLEPCDWNANQAARMLSDQLSLYCRLHLAGHEINRSNYDSRKWTVPMTMRCDERTEPVPCFTSATGVRVQGSATADGSTSDAARDSQRPKELVSRGGGSGGGIASPRLSQTHPSGERGEPGGLPGGDGVPLRTPAEDRDAPSTPLDSALSERRPRSPTNALHQRASNQCASLHAFLRVATSHAS